MSLYAIAAFSLLLGASFSSAKPPSPPPFACPVLSPSTSPPVDVRHIRPTDVKVFLAMGDSITAAFAAKEHVKLDGIREFRGLSWSIGGDVDAYTVPNFFARVSGHRSAPLGASLGVQIPLEAVKIKGHPIRDWDPRVDQLNGAVSLAKIEDLDAQMDYLVAEVKKIKGIDFENDWKVLTILIGANNLCASCQPGRKDVTPEFFDAKYVPLVLHCIFVTFCAGTAPFSSASATKSPAFL